MLIRSRQSGDTLIEVMLSVVILSTVTLGGFSIMNKGLAISYGVLERTETRSVVSQQIELVGYIRDQYALAAATGSGAGVYPATLWTDIRDNRDSDLAASVTSSPVNCLPTTGSKPFFIERNTGDTAYQLTTYNPLNTPTTIPAPGKGLWIEAVPSPASVAVGYIDLYVKACWDSVTGTQKETISSTVRLYDR